MRDFQEHVLFTGFVLVLTALAIVAVLIFTQGVLKQDRAEFCKETEPLTPVLLPAPQQRGRLVGGSDGMLQAAPITRGTDAAP